MLISRGLVIGRSLKKVLSQSVIKTPNVVSVRNSGHVVNYRTGPPPHSKATVIGAEVVAGLMWWWVLWHLYHEHEHITGEFEYPDPSSWTDQELGITS